MIIYLGDFSAKPRIIDFGYGHTGSIHDSTAFDDTSMSKNHDSIFSDDEFIWADSAYVV